MQAVRKHEPYAAEHGSKIHVWEKVALETQLNASTKNSRISSRAVSDRCVHVHVAFASDLSIGSPSPPPALSIPERVSKCGVRFRLLMRLHKNGTLRLKHRTESNAEVVDATIDALDGVVARMDEVKLQGNPRRKRRKGLGSRPILDGLAVPESVDVEFAAPLPSSGNEGAHEHEGATSGFRLRSDEESDTSPLNVITAAEDMNIVIPPQDERDPTQLLAAQALELKREKLELKKRKLEMLAQQHAERMALLQRRMELEEQRARDESAARRSEWAALLAALRGAPGVADPQATTVSSSEATANL